MQRIGIERSEANGSASRSLMSRPLIGALTVCVCLTVARQMSAAPMAAATRTAGPAHARLSWVNRDPAPEPRLGPDTVVGIVLHALQHNDDPVADHGIAVTFAFTSPENHDVTGPIGRFRALVKSSAYRPMLGHTRAARGPLLVVAEHARERVMITGAHGERAVYMFLLSRQETGAYKGCWMADGVLREADAALNLQPPPLVTAVALRSD